MKSARVFAAIAAILALGIIASACQSSPDKSAAGGETTPAAESTSSATASVPAGGARLWEQTCARCHNYRRPRSRTDAEWALILHHMRVRANIPASDAREILRFLQSAN